MNKSFFAFLIFPLLVVSQGNSKYPTLLWKITGNGLNKASYLYGTMHVSNRAAYYLSEEFFAALQSAEAVGLETNPGEWMQNMEETGELSELNQFNSGAYYSRNFYKSAFSNSLPSEALVKNILSYEPDIINGLLYRQHRSRENFEESTYIDLFIYQTASKLNKPVISLENFAQSEIYARLASLPDEYGEDYGSLDYSDYQTIGVKIEDAYREGNLSKLDSLSKISSTGNTMKYLIKERNFFFVRTMDSVMRTRSLFAGVGAAHLPGDFGVIEMLRDKGYKVEPITPRFSDKSIKLRQKFEAKSRAVDFRTYTAPDSAFSVSLPGKLYPIASVDNLKYLLFADMVNGAYYSVSRLKYLGPVYQVSSLDMQSLFDRLFFENLPGKIIYKKELSHSPGMRAVEILNQTRQGDQQRYRFYFSDVEIFIFKLGGKAMYASGPEGNQFFKSIQLLQQPRGLSTYTPTFKFDYAAEGILAWKNFKPATGGFSCTVPAGFCYEKYKNNPLNGLTEDLYAYDPGEKLFCGIKQAVFNDFNYLEEDSFELNQLAKRTLEAYSYTIEPEYILGKEQNLPSIRFKASNANHYYMTGKVYIKGVHYYLLYTVSPQAVSFDQKFFKNFNLCDFEYTSPRKVIRDNDFYFSVKDEVSDDAISHFNEAYARAYAKEIGTKRDTSLDYDVRVDNKYYYSPSSNECVNISLEKYNDYDYRNPEEVNEKILKRYTNSGSFKPRQIDKTVKDGSCKYHYQLSDTATSRALDSRLFISKGLLMEIVAPFDTTIGLKGWTEEFMNSFKLLDTLPGRDIFKNKFNLLLNDLCSEDTLLRRRANNSLKNSISLQKEYVDEFVKFIASPRFGSVNEDSKAQLLVNGGVMENESVIAPYKKLYFQYTDSFYLQLCIIKGLAFLKTQKSYDAIYDLLMKETPLVGSDVTVNDVFSSMHDSIELCRKFFPGLLSIKQHNEYRDAVYALLAELIKSGVTSSSVCALNREDMLKDAELSLKRYNPSLVQGSFQENNPGAYASLDKNAKELAENLQRSLQGFNNNRVHRGSDYLRLLDSYSRPALVNYAIVLAPYYKQDAGIRAFFSKLSKVKPMPVMMSVHLALLRNGIDLNDTLNSYFSKNKYTRAYFYSELEKEKQLNYFDTAYASQLKLVESVLAIQRQLSGFYGSDKEKQTKDSMIFVKRLPVQNKYQKGDLYMFRTQKLMKSEQKWCLVFADSKPGYKSNIEVYSLDFTMDPEKSQEDNEREVQDYFSLGYRKRANLNPQN